MTEHCTTAAATFPTPLAHSGSEARAAPGGIATIFRRVAALIATWEHRERSRRALAELDDRLLRDVGLSRTDVARETMKPFWMP